MNDGIKKLLGSDHPVLETVAQYFFNSDGGKKIRPALVMLMARAGNAHMDAGNKNGASMNWNQLFESQRRLAEITEMIHTASLLHDDVIDVADTRRGIKVCELYFHMNIYSYPAHTHTHTHPIFSFSDFLSL